MTRSQVVLLVTYLCSMVLGLGITAVVGSILEEDQFGFFALVGTIFAVSALLLDLGTGSLAVREITRDPDRERPLLEGLMGWRRLAGAVLAVVVIGMALVQPDGQRQGVLFAVAAVLVCMGPSALHPVFQVRQSLEAPSVLALAGQSLVLVGALVFKFLAVPGAVFAGLLALRELLRVGGLRFLAARHLGPLRPGVRGRALKPFLIMALAQGSATLLQAVYFYVDVFLVWILRDDSELGAYAAAFRPIHPLLMLPGLLLSPLLPVLSKVGISDRPGFARHVAGAATLLLGIGAIGGVAGTLVAPELVDMLYDGRYSGGQYEAVTAFRWLSLSFAVVFLGATANAALLADGRERTLLKIAGLGFGINVLANLILIPRYGFTAAALTTLVTEVVVAGLGWTVVMRTAGVHLLGAAQMKAVLPAAAIAVILTLMGGPPWLRVVVAIVTGIVGVAVILTTPAARSFRQALSRDVDQPEQENP